MPKRRRLTAEDLLTADSGLGPCELWDGSAVVREPSGGRAEVVAWRVMKRVGEYVEAHDLGWVVSSNQGFLLREDPDRVLTPDGAFVSKERLAEVPRRGYMPCAPDFALEVHSPDLSWDGVVVRGGIWIAHGAKTVWTLDPLLPLLVVHRPAEDPELLGAGEVANARPALPGLRVAVSDLVAGL